MSAVQLVHLTWSTVKYIKNKQYCVRVSKTTTHKNVNIYCCFWILHWKQKHSEYTQKLYNNIWFHKGSEHILYYNLQKSTLQKFKILNIKKYSCRNRCRTGTRNCSGYRSVRKHGDITIQRKRKSSLYLQLVLKPTTDRRNKNILQNNSMNWNDHINYGSFMHPKYIILQDTPLQSSMS